MVKKVEQFRVSCLKLLSLIYDGKLDPEEDGYTIRNGRIFSYKHGYNLELHKLIDALFEFDSTILENNTKKYVEKKIDDFLFECFVDAIKNKTLKIDYFFKRLEKDLRHTEEYLVPLPIENLSVYSEITIGKIRFLPYSEENYFNLFKEVGYTAKNGESLLKLNTSSPFMKKVGSIGVVTVSAGEVDKAIEKAEELINQALNIIRFFNIYYDFGIVGKYDYPYWYKVYTINISKKLLHYTSGFSGDTQECKFTKIHYDELWKDYISNIDAILKKPESKRETMENKLLLAFNWFGEIQKNKNHKENIIRIFSALETLLISNKNEEKGYNVAERIVFINYPDRESRLSASALIKKMYKYRNNLVHEGATNFKELDYNTLLMQLHHCMAIIAKHVDKYPKLEQWIEIINDAKLDKKLSFQ